MGRVGWDGVGWDGVGWGPISLGIETAERMDK